MQNWSKISCLFLSFFIFHFHLYSSQTEISLGSEVDTKNKRTRDITARATAEKSVLQIRNDTHKLNQLQEERGVTVQYVEKYQKDLTYAHDQLSGGYLYSKAHAGVDKLRKMPISDQSKYFAMYKASCMGRMYEHALNPEDLFNAFEEKLVADQVAYQERMAFDPMWNSSLLATIGQAEHALLEYLERLQQLTKQEDLIIGRRVFYQDTHRKMIELLYGDARAARAERWAQLTSQLLSPEYSMKLAYDKQKLLQGMLNKAIAPAYLERQNKMKEQALVVLATRLHNPVIYWQFQRQLEKMALEDQQKKDWQAQQEQQAESHEREMMRLEEKYERNRLIQVAQEKNKARKRKIQESKAVSKIQQRKKELELVAAAKKIAADDIQKDKDEETMPMQGQLEKKPSNLMYQEFLVEIEQSKKDRDKFFRKLKNDKKLTPFEKQNILQEYDQQQPHLIIYSLLHEYVHAACDDEQTDEKILRLHQLSNTIFVCHKEILSDDKKISWYLSLFKDLDKKIADRYKQLDDEFRDQTIQNINYWQDVLSMQYENLQSELVALEESFQAAKSRNDRDTMRERLRAILDKKSEIELLHGQCEQWKLRGLYMKLYGTMKLLHGIGGVLDTGLLYSGVDLFAPQSGVLDSQLLKDRFVELEERFFQILQIPVVHLEVKDEALNIPQEQNQQVHDSIVELLRSLFVEIGLSEQNCNELPIQIVASTRMFAPAYAHDMLDIDSLNYRLQEKFKNYCIDFPMDCSQAQINDVVKIQIMLIKSFARTFHKKL